MEPSRSALEAAAKSIGKEVDIQVLCDPEAIRALKAGDREAHDARVLKLADKLEAIAPVFRAVCGNVDGASLRRRFKEMETFEVEGVKVVMTHIGGYPGKYAPGIRQRLELSRPKLFVCGHSHILKVMPDRALGCLVVNPGAAGVQGWQVVRTLVTLTLDDGNITHAQVIELAK